MSQSSPQQTTPISRSIRNVGLNPSSTAGTDSSLFYEFCDTVRRLLQHIVFIPLLTLRLYMLPLLYISSKLATRNDAWHTTTWHFLRYPGRTLALCARGCKRDGNVSLVETWKNIRNCIFTTLGVVRALYSLGKLIGDDPNVLQPDPVLLLGAPDSAIDVRSHRERDSKVFESDWADSQLEAAGRASQIYHAALHNGSTLDDILAAFERNMKTPPAAQNSQPLICQGPLDPTENRADDQPNLLDPPAEHRYRTVSIQTTPEKMSQSRRDTENPPYSVQEEGKAGGEEELPTPVVDTEGGRKRAHVEDRREGHAIGSSPHASMCHDGHHNSATKTEARGVATTLKRCPTFVRRQTKARVPERPVSGDQRTLAVLQERAARSTPTLALSSPTRRAKLQRKVRVYQDSGKDIEFLKD